MRTGIRHFTSFALALVCCTIVSVSADELKDYDKQTFKAAINSENPVLLAFHAKWCGTCIRQRPILERLLSEDKFTSLVPIRVDYDDHEDIRKRWGVETPSTLVLLKHGKEHQRTVGLTNYKTLKAFLATALED